MSYTYPFYTWRQNEFYKSTDDCNLVTPNKSRYFVKLNQLELRLISFQRP